MKKIFNQNCKGQALVETAFVLMIIVMFTFGITEFGRAMYIKNMLNNAARAAVREAVVTGSLANTTYAVNEFNNCTTPTGDRIKDKICTSLMYVGNKNTISASVACQGNCTPAEAGAVITVTVEENNFQSFAPKLIPITAKLVGKASMRYE